MQLRATSVLFASSAFTNVVGIATGILSARLLGPEGRGELASFVFWSPFLAGVLGFSLHTAAAFHTARLTGKARRQAEFTLVALAVRLALLMAPVAYFALLVIDSTDYRSFIGFCAILYFAAEIIRPTVLGIYAGRGEYSRVALYQLIPSLLTLTMFGVFVGQGSLGVREAAFSISAGSIFTAVLLITETRCFTVSKHRFCRQVIGSTLRLHPPLLLQLVKAHFDRLLILLLLPAGSIGIYFVAYTFASAPFASIQQAFASQLMTDFSSAKRASEIRQKLTNALSISGTAATILSLGLVIVLPPAIPLLVGPGFEAVAGVALILVVAFAMRMLVEVVLVYLRSIRAWRWLGIIEVSYMVSFALSCILSGASAEEQVAYSVLHGFTVSALISFLAVLQLIRSTAQPAKA